MFVVAGVAVNTLGKKTLQGNLERNIRNFIWLTETTKINNPLNLIFFFISAICSLIAGICPIIIYFWSNSTIMLVLFPIILAFGELGGNVLLTVTLELFPTTFR